MKNLKKFLAVVLAVAMCFSLLSMSANAAFSDQKDISAPFANAVDMMNNLGIITGVDGAMQPKTILTREMGAKIIAYTMLGKSVADNLKSVSAPFSDVVSTRWSAGYIAFCAEQKIVGGDGTGKFNPEGTLTGVQFAKMLLVALGYGQNKEYDGSNWSISILKDALTVGIFNGNLGVDYGAGVSREAAALYAFNTLRTKTVTAEYQYDQGVKYVTKYNVDTTTLGAQKYTLTNHYGNLISNEANEGAALVGKSTIYDASLTVPGNVTVPVVTTLSQVGSNVSWYTWMESGVMKYSNAYSYVFNRVVTVPTNLVTANPASYQQLVSTWLTANSLTLNVAAIDKGTNYEITGSSALIPANLVLAPAQNAYVIDRNGDGVIDAFMVNTPSIDFVTGNTTTTTANGLTSIYVPGVTTGYVSSFNAVGYAGLVKNDVVFVTTVANGGSPIYYIEKATSFTGKVTSFAGTDGFGTLFVDGKGYTVSPLASGSFDTVGEYTAIAGPTYGVTLTLYTDANGKLVYAVPETATTSFAVVMRVEPKSDISADTSYQALLLLPDGTTKTVDVAAASDTAFKDATYHYGAGDTAYTKLQAGTFGIAYYTIGATGAYTLKAAAGATLGSTTYAALQTATDYAITKNNALLAPSSETNAGAGITVIGDANTTFLKINYSAALGIVTGYTAYTGIANAPSLLATGGNGTDFTMLTTNTGLAKLAVIYNNVDNTAAATGSLFYVSGGGITYAAYNPATMTYAMSGYIAGTPKTLTVPLSIYSTFTGAGLYNVVLSGDAVTAASAASAMTNGSGAGYIANTGSLIANTAGTAGYFTYASDCVVYYVDTAAATVTVQQPGDIALKDMNDTISVYGTDTTKVATAVVITKNGSGIALTGNATAAASATTGITTGQIMNGNIFVSAADVANYVNGNVLTFTPANLVSYKISIDGAGTDVVDAVVPSSYTLVAGDTAAGGVITVTIQADDGNTTYVNVFTITNLG